MCVAVASTILGTSLITRVLGHPTVRIHLYEVESGVETAFEGGQIDVEGELLVLQLEHVVRIVVGQEVAAGANVAVRHELEGEGVVAGSDTVFIGVFGTFKGAVISASFAIRAKRRIPGLARVIEAVSFVFNGMEIAPVGVEDDLGLDGGALRIGAAARTLLDGELGVDLLLQSTDLLSLNGGEEKEGGGSS